MNDLNTQLLKLISLAGRAHCNVQHLEQLAINAAALRDWQSLAEVTEHHGMVPLLYSHCRTAEVAIPVEVRRQLQVLTLRQRVGNQTRAKALAEILIICKTEGLEVLIIKDAALAWTVYPSPGLRPIHSLELLTLPSQVKRLEEILLSCGYHLPEGEDGVTVSPHLHKGLWRMQDGLRVRVVTHAALMIKNQITGERNIATVLERGKAFMLADSQVLSLHSVDMLGQAYQDLINAPMKVIHCSDLISVAEQFTDEIDWDQVRKIHPGIVATLELLHCMNPLEEHLIQVANLSVSSRVVHFGENFFNALIAIEPNVGMSGNKINVSGGDQPLRQNVATHEHPKQNEDGLELTRQSFQAVWDSLHTRHHASSEQPQLKKAIDTLVTLEPQWPLGADISRRIHQTWKQPPPNWSVMLWTDTANRELIRQKLTIVSYCYFDQRFHCGPITLPNNVILVGWVPSENGWYCVLDTIQQESSFTSRLPATLSFLQRYVLPKLSKKQKPLWLMLCYYDGWRERLIFSEKYQWVKVKSLEKLEEWQGNPGEIPLMGDRRWIACYGAHHGDPSALLLPEAHYLSRNFYELLFVRTARRRVPWSSKQNSAVYCGGNHGEQANYFSPIVAERPPQRQYLQQIAVNLPVDVYLNERVPKRQQLTYKYILDIDGYTRTWDAWAWKMYCGSVILSIRSPWESFFTSQFSPWKHYIPIANDLSDLGEKIEWCRSHDAQCQKMAQKARLRAETVYDVHNVAQRVIQSLNHALKNDG